MRLGFVSDAFIVERWETGFTAGEMGNTGCTAGETGIRVHCWRDGKQGSLLERWETHGSPLERWETGFTAGEMGNMGFPGLDHCSEVVLRSSAFHNTAFSFGKIVRVEPSVTAKETTTKES